MKKTVLRKIYLEKRLELSETAVSKKSMAIKDLLFSRLMMHRYDKVHCFLPVKDRNEVDTNIIINTLHKDFPISVYVPKIGEDGILTHHLYEANTPTEENKWGIPEPINNGVSSEDFFDTYDDILILVPLLAFDKKGQRVGYGKGFYDRFLALATENTTVAGLSFFEVEKEIEDVEETDVPLQYVITGERVYSF